MHIYVLKSSRVTNLLFSSANPPIRVTWRTKGKDKEKMGSRVAELSLTRAIQEKRLLQGWHNMIYLEQYFGWPDQPSSGLDVTSKPEARSKQ